MERHLKRQCLPNPIEPVYLARMVLFLASDEQWEFDEHGYMRHREASSNDVPISEADRKFRWPLGPRPADHPGLSELGM